MATIRVAEFEDSFVIHFGGEFRRINAYTLASTLIGIADAARAANAVFNPGYEIEIVVEALGAGSFRTKIRAIYRAADNLFTRETVRNIALGVIASFIYERTLAPDTQVIVQVSSAEVVIQQGENRIVVPRAVHEAAQQAERDPQFMKGMGQAFRAVEQDSQIESVGISKDETEPHPPIVIPRERFVATPVLYQEDESDERDLVETTDVEILRAILDRSRRRWEFVWNGMKISAPVSDQQFFDDFFAHRITIAPGDALRVRLRIHQIRVPDVGVFINQSYEVIEVMKHIRRTRQGDLSLDEDGT